MTNGDRLEFVPIGGLPLFVAGMSVAAELAAALARADDPLCDGDVVVIAQKIVSKAEGRTVDPADVIPGEDAKRIAQATGREACAVQLIIDESAELMRVTPAAIIARHHSGHVLANAGIDASNVAGDALLLWPIDPDASARAIRAELGDRIGVIIADSMGRAWRIGTCGTAIGVAGLTVLDDRRGLDADLYGRTLQATIVAVADSLAAAAVLVMGEGAEGLPAVRVRGAARWVGDADGPGAVSGLRPVAQDMFR